MAVLLRSIVHARQGVNAALVVLLAVAGLAGCRHKPATTMVLDYQDFGPQVAAHEVIGMAWWQWDQHGEPDPDDPYDIKVVVYRDISMEQVQELFPVLEEKGQDYRYLSYAQAISYLNETILEDVLSEVTRRLRQTRTRVEAELGESSPGESR